MLSCFRWLMAVIRKLIRWGKNDRSVDHLSFCPCLVEILQMVDRADVFSCRLVNHRLNGVIRKNRATMPKEKVRMDIGAHIEFGVTHLLIYVISEVYRIYFLTDRHISIWKSGHQGIRSVDTYFAMTAIPVETTELDRDDSLRKLDSRMAGMAELYPDCETLRNGRAKCYQLKGINEGLRPLARLLFGRYSFSEMKILMPRGIPETCVRQWLQVVGEELASSVLDVFSKDDINDVIPSLRLCRVKEVYIQCKIESPTCIVDLLRDTQRNARWPTYIRIFNETYDIYRWSCEPILEALSHFTGVTIVKKSTFWKLLVAKIRRLVDGKVITMKYDRAEIIISYQ